MQAARMGETAILFYDQQGYMYFLANDPQVPEALRERVNRFGLTSVEFTEAGHWPHHLYVREGRRMLSDYVMTQN